MGAEGAGRLAIPYGSTEARVDIPTDLSPAQSTIRAKTPARGRADRWSPDMPTPGRLKETLTIPGGSS